MFGSISLAVRQFCTMFSVLFSAGEHAARAVEYLAITAEETAGAYCDEARVERSKKLAALNAELSTAEKVSAKIINAKAVA